MRSQEKASARFRLLLLAVLLLLLAIPKLLHSVGEGPYGFDASYYFQIARNVTEGEGLVTNVSLYHVGLKDLPQRTNFYPLWPLVLGLTGRMIGLVNAVDLLPRLLYFIDLILLYVLANRLVLRVWGSPRLFEWRWSPDLGHLLVLLLGLNPIFFAATTHPYTEGLAYALAFTALLLLDLSIDRTPLLWASIAGVAAGLAFLTRTQMIILLPAGTLALALLTLRHWRRFLSACISYALIGGAAYVLWRQIFLVGSREYRDPELGGFQSWVRSESWLEFMQERLSAVLASFDVWSHHSVTALFGPAALLVPIAIVVLLWELLRRRKAVPRLTDPRMALLVATVLTGAFSYAALTMYHGTFFRPWLFGWRHGLPFIFLIIPAVGFLVAGRTIGVRIFVVLLFLFSIGIGAGGVVTFVSAPEPSGPSMAEAELIEWLERHHESPPTLLTTHAQTLAVHADAYFHWTQCTEPPAQTRLMLERLPIDYVLVYGSERGCSFADYEKLSDLLEVKARFGAEPQPLLLLGRRGGQALQYP